MSESQIFLFKGRKKYYAKILFLINLSTKVLIYERTMARPNCLE